MDQTQLKNLENVLKNYGQTHLLAFWDRLGPAQRDDLLAQLSRLDFARIDRWRREYVTDYKLPHLCSNLAPPECYPPQPTDPGRQCKYDQARRLGKDLISKGKVAAFVVAGGQGTRLGFKGPKGDFPVSPVKNKTLFQIFAESILGACEKYNTTLPWLIMTSPLNHDQTLEVFETNDYYGLNKRDVFIFQQGTLPNFDPDGKILLADKGAIAASPDGHGGSLRALHNSGVLANMKNRGVEFLSYWQIDNPLVNILDPLFIGLHALDGAQMSSKAIIKTGPFEKLGVFCLADGKVTVVEYSDLPRNLAEKRNADGSLVFELGSIAIHIISVAFVEQLNKQGFALPLHRAIKKITHIDAAGQRVEPTKPNGIKLESFIFDALPLCSKSIILQTLRSEEFAPVKNATGLDSAETTRQMMVARAADWLESAGITVPRKPDDSPDCTLEIAPSFALTKEDVAERRDRIPKINPGDKLCLA